MTEVRIRSLFPNLKFRKAGCCACKVSFVSEFQDNFEQMKFEFFFFLKVSSQLFLLMHLK